MLSVREFLASDYDAVLEIDVEAQREYRGPSWDAMQGEERSRLLMTKRELVGAYVASGFALVAEEAGAIRGFLFAWPLPDGRLVVVALAVRQGARRRGIAGALYRHLSGKARDGGVAEVRALISEDNVASQRLHRSLGFALRRRVEAVLEIA